MTKEQIMALIAAAANPDQAPVALSELKDGIMEIYATNDALMTENSTIKTDNTNLRDINTKVMLRNVAQGLPAETEEKELTNEEIFDKLFTQQVTRVEETN